jgi:sulfoxide reductase heme-binding subunit YedZ
MASQWRPWLDSAGRLSALKAPVLALLFVPGTWIAVDFWQGNLGPRPWDEAIHQIGLWTIRLLFLSLAVTPLRQLLRWPQLLQVRRMIGVAAFVYAAAHLFLYVGDQKFDLPKVATEIAIRIYLAIGFAALLGLAALAATSTDGMVRRLGGRAWRRLHQAIYVIAVLAAIHFFMQSKLNVQEPTVMAGLLLWLLGYRLVGALGKANRRAPARAALLLALAAAALTALGEAAYFWVAMGVDPAQVLAAHLAFDIGIRPAWVVAGIGAAVALVAGASQALDALADRRLRPA